MIICAFEKYDASILHPQQGPPTRNPALQEDDSVNETTLTNQDTKIPRSSEGFARIHWRLHIRDAVRVRGELSKLWHLLALSIRLWSKKLS